MWRRPNVARGVGCCMADNLDWMPQNCMFGGFDCNSTPHNTSQESGLQWGAPFVRRIAKPNMALVWLRDLCGRCNSQYFSRRKQKPSLIMTYRRNYAKCISRYIWMLPSVEIQDFPGNSFLQPYAHLVASLIAYIAKRHPLATTPDQVSTTTLAHHPRTSLVT